MRSEQNPRFPLTPKPKRTQAVKKRLNLSFQLPYSTHIRIREVCVRHVPIFIYYFKKKSKLFFAIY